MSNNLATDQQPKRHIGFAALRQLFFDPTFRIELPRIHREEQTPMGSYSSKPTDRTANGERAPVDAMAEAAISLWYVRSRLQPKDDQPSEKKTRLLLRRIDKAIAELEAIDLTIDDPIGRPYEPGSLGTMEAHLETRADITAETVVETLSPMVYWQNRLIRRGEVFVAVPEAKPAVEARSNAFSGDPSGEVASATDP